MTNDWPLTRRYSVGDVVDDETFPLMSIATRTCFGSHRRTAQAELQGVRVPHGHLEAAHDLFLDQSGEAYAAYIARINQYGGRRLVAVTQAGK